MAESIYESFLGARQLCCKCGEPTRLCEEDDLWLEDGTGPLCTECFEEEIK